jgi:SAM-dependent methyltransferase
MFTKRSAGGRGCVTTTGAEASTRSWNWPDAEEYGDQWAHDYDALDNVAPGWTDAAVAGLARLAGRGTVLEVAAGTGRVAIPLTRKGLHVTATDASPKMLERLRDKAPGGLLTTRVEVLPAIGGSNYSVIAILANSLWVLETSAAQQAFLNNAAASLAPDGVAVVEMGVADPARWNAAREVRRGGHVVRLSTVWDGETQRVRHRFCFPTGVHPPQRDVYLRYLTPHQLLRMATAAGFAPRHVWSDWHGTPFGADSRMMIAAFSMRGQPDATGKGGEPMRDFDWS